MKEIKTILYSVTGDGVSKFDKEVNAFLAAGYTLVKREYYNAIPTTDGEYIYSKLYAELER